MAKDPAAFFGRPSACNCGAALEIFYPDKPYPNLAATYSLEELQSIVSTDVLLRVPPAEQARYAQERYRFTGWEVGLELIKRAPDGNGVARYFVPLEVLLGLRPY